MTDMGTVLSSANCADERTVPMSSPYLQTGNLLAIVMPGGNIYDIKGEEGSAHNVSRMLSKREKVRHQNTIHESHPLKE